MNIADYLRRQFVFNDWANREVLTVIEASGKGRERSLQLFAHILSAERLWLERLQGKPPSTPVWPQATVEGCQEQAAGMARLWREYLEPITSGDLSQSISYKNTKGEAWTNTILDVLTHVILHSTYHRGQIASHTRASGEAPAYTDFIHGVRQGVVR
ncbi:MAG TPA: DinB family protein [Verrucomicrobiae bacterium]|nr:DinB family protein [Verrucomicrobiae bacterium]